MILIDGTYMFEYVMNGLTFALAYNNACQLMKCVTVLPPIVLLCNCDHNHGIVVLDQVFIMFLELDNYPCTVNLIWIVTVSGLKIGLNTGIRWIIEFKSEFT